MSNCPLCCQRDGGFTSDLHPDTSPRPAGRAGAAARAQARHALLPHLPLSRLEEPLARVQGRGGGSGMSRRGASEPGKCRGRDGGWSQWPGWWPGRLAQLVLVSCPSSVTPSSISQLSHQLDLQTCPAQPSISPLIQTLHPTGTSTTNSQGVSGVCSPILQVILHTQPDRAS